MSAAKTLMIQGTASSVGKSVAKRFGLPQITDEEMANIMGGTAAKLYKIKA